MKDRIKFSDEMLSVVIGGRKTQTRRPMNPQPKLTESNLPADGYTLSEQACAAWRAGFIDDDCPYGQVGDVIPFADKDGNIKGEIEIVDVWLQQVQEISQEDALAEGFEGYDDDVSGGVSPYSEFSQAWVDIYGKDSWRENPWVWVIEFKQIQG